MSHMTCTTRTKMKEFDLKELEVATESFSPSRLIGKGSHGSVYRGVLNDGSHVAVKKQSLGLRKLQDDSKLENEARILSLFHQNTCLINLLGTSHDASGSKMIVTDYMPHGTLHDILHLSTTVPSWPKRVETALQIAKGVCFMHESTPSIVHRDIKSANILFDENWNAKIADFGLAIRLNSDDELNPPAGTIGYLDPSYTTASEVSTKIDVYSYGVVLVELISGRKVMDMLQSPPSIVEWALPLIKKGRFMEVCDKRVHLPREMEATIKRLLGVAVCCLSPLENLRPKMSEIVLNMENSIVVETTRFPVFMDFIRDIVVSMMRKRKFKYDTTTTTTITTSGACADHNWGSGHDGNSSLSKGTLLVREILADITLK